MLEAKQRNQQLGSNKPNSCNKQKMTGVTPWFSTHEILEYLGITQSELEEQLNLFTEGIHYKLEKTSKLNSQILWRVDLVDEVLCLPIPPLEKEAMLKAINNHITCRK